MEEKKENLRSFKAFTFGESYSSPKYKLNKGRNIVEWGWESSNLKMSNNRTYGSNSYPFYILDLYNHYGSPSHKAIIDKKVRFVAGQGFEDELLAEDPALKEFARKNDLEHELIKLALDYELFNGFCFEVIWNKEGTKINKIKHVNFQKVRLGLPTDEDEKDTLEEYFWYSEDWENYRKAEYSPQYIKKFNPHEPGGRQLFYHVEYNPESEYYPVPSYSNAFNWIELDYEISKFHLNSSKNGYSPSFMLTFGTGIPSEEEQDDFARAFKREYGGNPNAGKIIISYADGSDGLPQLDAISSNDSDDRFVNLEKQIKEEIIRASGVPLQMLSVVPGSLGSTDERLELMQEFQMDYVSPRQYTIEKVFNRVLNTNKFRLKKYRS